jgi:hypothetical protein
VPTGWTREAQVAAGNEDTSSLNTIKLTPSPAPKLFVQPVHPFFSRKACVPSDCLPAGKGRHLLATGRNSRIAPLRQQSQQQQQQQQQAEEEEQEDAVAAVDAAELELLQENAAAGEAPVVAELQRMDADSNGLSRGLNNLLWNLPYNPFGRRRGASGSSSSGSSNNAAAAPAPAPTSSSSSTGAPSDAASPATPPTTSSGGSSSKDAAAAPAAGEDLEAGTGALAPIIGRGGSGSNSLKESIGGGGWTEWKEDEDWWGGEERNLQACLTTVAQPAAYDILWNIDGGVAKKATMPKQGAPFILLDNLDTLAPVGGTQQLVTAAKLSAAAAAAAAECVSTCCSRPTHTDLLLALHSWRPHRMSLDC